MLHAKFQDHRTSGSGEDFTMILPYVHGGHLGHVTWTIYNVHRLWFPLPKEVPQEIWL